MRKTELLVGGFAWLDGRDPNAQPPLTVGTIQLWNSPERTRVVCRLRHGTRVRILEKAWRRKDDRWYYRVRCQLWEEGWVPKVFLSAEKPGVVGDVVLDIGDSCTPPGACRSPQGRLIVIQLERE